MIKLIHDDVCCPISAARWPKWPISCVADQENSANEKFFSFKIFLLGENLTFAKKDVQLFMVRSNISFINSNPSAAVCSLVLSDFVWFSINANYIFE